MTKEELAALINGREYTEETTKKEDQKAKDAGLVILFGASDDLAEFRGAIHDETGTHGGKKILVSKNGVLDSDHDCDCEFCGFKELRKNCAVIEALWCAESSYSWTFKTSIPHATFEIVEDREKYCRGIVFNFSDLPTA